MLCYSEVLGGRVYCKADDTSVPIEPRDLFTTSDTPDYVMKVNYNDRAHGTTIGKGNDYAWNGSKIVIDKGSYKETPTFDKQIY